MRQTDPPPSASEASLALDLPRESRRSFVSRRDGGKDEAGAGYELTPGLLRLELETGTTVGAAVRMNATSVWFEPEKRKTIPYGQTVRLRLVASPRSLEASPESFEVFSAKIGIDALDEDVYAVARLLEVKLATGRELVKFMLDAAERGVAHPVRPRAAVRTDISDPVRVRVVVASLSNRSAPALMRRRGEAEGTHVQLDTFNEATGDILWTRTPAPAANTTLALTSTGPTDETSPVVVEVAGYNCTYQLEMPTAQDTPAGIMTPLPNRVVYARYRRYRRASVPGGTNVRFDHPLWNEIRRFNRQLIDVSFGGIAFQADPFADALYIGLRVDLLEVITETGEPILLRGTVRSLGPGPDGQITCGMSVEAWSPEHAATWATYVMQSLNQTTAPGHNRVEQLWELYTDSGYFNLSGKEPEEFDSISQAFRKVIERTRTVPWLTYQSVWPSKDCLEASVSTIRVYRNTWMLHQLAKRRAAQGDPRARHILRDTYLRAFEYMQADVGCNWVLSYAEANVRWVQRSHIAFAEHFEPTGAALARPFRLMEANCRERSEVTPLAIFRIAAAAPDERQIILEELRRKLPAPYLEACDLTQETFDLASPTRAWKEVGLEREREIWVARYRGVSPVAAAILETGETGTNLFRLLDSVRLVALQPGGEAAFLGLLEKAKAWFLARGKEDFVYFWEHPDSHHVRTALLRDLGEGRVWVIRSDLIPDFLELVCELTAHREGPDPGRPEHAVPGPAPRSSGL